MEQYNNKAIASLVLGIVSLFFSLFSLLLTIVIPYIGWFFTMILYICAIIGLIFGIQIRKASRVEGFKPSGMATAGFVLNIIGLVTGCISLLPYVFIIVLTNLMN